MVAAAARGGDKQRAQHLGGAQPSQQFLDAFANAVGVGAGRTDANRR